MEMSGLGRYALEITRGLWRVRPEWQFSVYSNRPDLLGPPQRGSRRGTRWPTSFSAGRVAWLHLGASPIALVRRPDVWFGPTFVLPVWWRGPAVVTIQDLVFLLLRDRYIGKANAVYATAATRFAARRATRVICPSGETRNALVEAWGVSSVKIDLVANGVSDLFFEAPVSSGTPSRNSDGEPPFLLYVGVFEARKGLDVLATAMSELNSHGTKARLVLVGRPGWGAEEAVELLEAAHRCSDSGEPLRHRAGFALPDGPRARVSVPHGGLRPARGRSHGKRVPGDRDGPRTDPRVRRGRTVVHPAGQRKAARSSRRRLVARVRERKGGPPASGTRNRGGPTLACGG